MFTVTILEPVPTLDTTPLNDMEYLLGAPQLFQLVPVVTQDPASTSTVTRVCTFGPAAGPCPTWFWSPGATDFTVQIDDESFVGLNEVIFTVQIDIALPHEFKFTVSITAPEVSVIAPEVSVIAPDACASAEYKYLSGVDLKMKSRIGKA